MECKDWKTMGFRHCQHVLMEPKWNVKHVFRHTTATTALVLMEPKWNVKKTDFGCKVFALAY